MKRRDFNRLVVGAGVSPIFAKSSLAQMSAEEIQTAPKIKGLPTFTTVKGGAYFFIPGIEGLRYLAALRD